MSPKWRRRRILVHDLQLRLLAFNLLYFMIFALVIGGFAFGPTAARLWNVGSSDAQRLAAAESFLLLHEWLWPGFFVVLGLYVLHALFVSHRVGGPAYRLAQTAKQIGGGNLGVRIKLRRNDYLKAEADAVNAMAIRLEDTVREALEETRELNRAAQCAAGAEELTERAGRVEAILERFELAQPAARSSEDARQDAPSEELVGPSA